MKLPQRLFDVLKAFGLLFVFLLVCI